MMKKIILTLLLFGGCSNATEHQVQVEGATSAVAGGKLTEAVGIETLGGVFTPLLESGCPLPCEVTQVFSTAEDGQTEILIHLFRGTGSLAKEAHALGTFRLSGVRALPRGQPQVRVRIAARASGITLGAEEIGTSSKVTVNRVAP